MEDILFFLVHLIDVTFVVRAWGAQYRAVVLNVSQQPLVETTFNILAGVRFADLPHVVPLPVHAGVSVARHNDILALGHGRAAQWMTLEYRLVVEFLPRRMDQIVHCPVGHSLQINVLVQTCV